MKFVHSSVAAVKITSGVVQHFIVAVDSRGEIWFFDTAAPEKGWQPLPPHPEITRPVT